MLVSGGGTNLQALMDAQDRGELGPARIVYVLSNRKAAYALERARVHGGIETDVLSKVMQPDPEKYDEALLQRLKAQRIDLIVLAGFLGIVGEKVLARYSGRILNIHPALIPSFCGQGFYGLHVHEAALARGVQGHGRDGASCERDPRRRGPILLQKAVDGAARRHARSPAAARDGAGRMARCCPRRPKCWPQRTRKERDERV